MKNMATYLHVVEADTLNCTVDEDCDTECDIEDGDYEPAPPSEEEEEDLTW